LLCLSATKKLQRLFLQHIPEIAIDYFECHFSELDSTQAKSYTLILIYEKKTIKKQGNDGKMKRTPKKLQAY